MLKHTKSWGELSFFLVGSLLKGNYWTQMYSFDQSLIGKMLIAAASNGHFPTRLGAVVASLQTTAVKLCGAWGNKQASAQNDPSLCRFVPLKCLPCWHHYDHAHTLSPAPPPTHTHPPATAQRIVWAPPRTLNLSSSSSICWTVHGERSFTPHTHITPRSLLAGR